MSPRPLQNKRRWHSSSSAFNQFRLFFFASHSCPIQAQYTHSRPVGGKGDCSHVIELEPERASFLSPSEPRPTSTNRFAMAHPSRYRRTCGASTLSLPRNCFTDLASNTVLELQLSFNLTLCCPREQPFLMRTLGTATRPRKDQGCRGQMRITKKKVKRVMITCRRLC